MMPTERPLEMTSLRQSMLVKLSLSRSSLEQWRPIKGSAMGFANERTDIVVVGWVVVRDGLVGWYY